MFRWDLVMNDPTSNELAHFHKELLECSKEQRQIQQKQCEFLQMLANFAVAQQKPLDLVMNGPASMLSPLHEKLLECAEQQKEIQQKQCGFLQTVATSVVAQLKVAQAGEALRCYQCVGLSYLHQSNRSF